MKMRTRVSLETGSILDSGVGLLESGWDRDSDQVLGLGTQRRLASERERTEK